MANDKITIRGDRVNNLKNIDIDLPRNKLIVMTGLSGSGKTSHKRKRLRNQKYSGTEPGSSGNVC